MRRGFALVAAIACLVVLGLVAAAALFASSQEARVTGASLLEQQVFAHAEEAAWLAVGGWSCPACDSLPPGSVITGSTQAEPPFESTVYTTRLDSMLYLVVAEGRIKSGGAIRLRRRIAIAVGLYRDSSGLAHAFPLRGQYWSAVHQM
jgi:hypothetical protein